MANYYERNLEIQSRQTTLVYPENSMHVTVPLFELGGNVVLSSVVYLSILEIMRYEVKIYL